MQEVARFYCHTCLVIGCLIILSTDSYAQTVNALHTLPGIVSKGFVENRGQFTDTGGNLVPNVLFKFQTNGVDVYLTKTGISYVYTRVHSDSIKIEDGVFASQMSLASTFTYETYRTDVILVNANPSAEIVKELPQKHYFNYYHAHCPEGISNVKSFKRITYKNIYPNIDWVLYPHTSTKGNFIKYDFVVHPGGKVEDLKILYNGFTQLGIDHSGDLLLQNTLGSLKEKRPYSFQGSMENEVQSSFVLEGSEASFKIEDYDRSRDLTIDPTLNWATYFGGTASEGMWDMNVDMEDNILISGNSGSVNFPVLNGYQSNLAGFSDAFVSKFDSSGQLLWATYYGGTLADVSVDISSDSNLNVVICGITESGDLPVFNAYQDSLNGSTNDAFVAKFDKNGTIQWATYYGGSSGDSGRNVTFDPWGNVIFSGTTFSSDFPLLNPFQSSMADFLDAFIVKLDSTGVLFWATYYGGTGNDLPEDIATDKWGNFIIIGKTSANDFPLLNPLQSTYSGGWDGFIVKFDRLNIRKWATYYGGSSQDFANSVAVDGEGGVALAGFSSSTNLPLFNAQQSTHAGGVFDAFIMKCDSNGVLQWATYFGGSDQDYCYGLGVDQFYNFYIAGNAGGSAFPLINPWQSFNAGSYDAFIVKFDSAGTSSWSTYFGGSSNDFGVAVTADYSGNIILAGVTQSSDLPVLNAYQPTLSGANEIYLLKFADTCIGETIVQHARICLGDSIFLGGAYQSTAGIYFDSLSNLKNCDSVIVSFLEVDSISTVSLFAFICQGDSILLEGAYQTSQGVYYDTLTSSNNCDSVILTILSFSPLAGSSTSITICAGDSVLLGGVYQSTPGTYYDTLGAISGCDSILETTLAVYPNYSIQDSADICLGDSVLLGGSYQDLPGLYFDSLSSVEGCDSIVATLLSVDSILYSTSSVSICLGDSMLLEGSYQNLPGLYFDSLSSVEGCDSVVATLLSVDSILYSTSSVSICSGDSILLAGAYQKQAGTYVDLLVTPQGCDSLATTLLSIVPLPIVDAGPDDTICLGASTKLNASSASNYSWSPTAGLSSSIIQNPIALPNITTTYTLAVYSGSCSDQDSVTIEVLDDCSIYIADIFSPNNDGNNDQLLVQGRGIQSIWFIIYDRWGKKVFETADVKQSWNGTYKGEPLNVGVYVYYIEVSFTNGVQKSEQGDVTLVR